MSVHRPQRVGHILQITICAVHRKGRVGALSLIDVAAHCLGSVDVEADDVVPRRVVKVVHTLLALLIVLVVLLGCVAVLRRAIEEVVARNRSKCQYGDSECFNYIFHCLFLHN